VIVILVQEIERAKRSIYFIYKVLQGVEL